MWIPTILLCGKHSTAVQTGIVSRLWFCKRLRGLKINNGWTLVHLFKSHVCANKLDVQEIDFSFTSTEAEIILTQVYAWTVSQISLSGIWWLKYFNRYRTKQMDPREPRWNPSAVVKPKMHNAIPIKHTNVIPTNIDHILSNTKDSDASAMLSVFQDNEAVN